MGNKSAGYNSVQTRLKCDRFSLKADVAPVSARFVPEADVARFIIKKLRLNIKRTMVRSLFPHFRKGSHYEQCVTEELSRTR